TVAPNVDWCAWEFIQEEANPNYFWLARGNLMLRATDKTRTMAARGIVLFGKRISPWLDAASSFLVEEMPWISPAGALSLGGGSKRLNFNSGDVIRLFDVRNQGYLKADASKYQDFQANNDAPSTSTSPVKGFPVVFVNNSLAQAGELW